MERRGEERRDIPLNSMGGFTRPAAPNHPEMAVKLQLPLAPILPERRGAGNPLLPVRRGTAIFSPTNTQNLDYPYLIINPRSSPPPPPPPDDDQEPESSPDPDPPSTTADDVSNSIRNNSPPQQPAAPVGAASSSSVKYRECLKNHAASMGGHVVDGCGEFMPSGDDGTPQSLKCAACDCHRNFHRKEIEGGGYYPPPAPSYNNNPQIGQITYSSVPPHQQQRRHHHKHQATPPTTMVNFGGGGGGGPAEESSSEDLSNMFQSGAGPQHRHRGLSSSSSKKRFRTKFSQEQKDRMQEFATRVGWRIQKQDEQEVQQFCTEVGITRQVFKVWMHNNKQAMKRRQPD